MSSVSICDVVFYKEGEAMTERHIEEEIKIKAQQDRKLAKYMSSTHDLVEEQIRKAQERGDFNCLEGAGKPLDLYENPFEPPELRMAFKILKENDFAPFWIELGKEIDADMERLNKEVDYFKRYTELFLADPHSRMAMQRYQDKKRYFYSERRMDLKKIARKIIDYNLQCPTFRQGRANLSVDNEMEKIIQSMEDIIATAAKK